MPVPGEHALDADHPEAIAEWLDRGEEGIASGGQILAEAGAAVGVEDVAVAGPGVQVGDGAVNGADLAAFVTRFSVKI